MDNLFKIRTLTTAINNLNTPDAVFWNRFFAPKGRMETSDRLAFDILSGSRKILKNLSVDAEAEIREQTSRTTVTMTAPRIAPKKFIPIADLNASRAFGTQAAPARMRDKIATEQTDMLNEIARTWEFQAVNAMKGRIYDSDGKTILCDYNMPATHRIQLDGTDVWTDLDDAVITTQFDTWQRLIADDSEANITSFVAYMGSGAWSNMLQNEAILSLLAPTKKELVATAGGISMLVNTELNRYLGSYIDNSDVRQRYVGTNEVILIGMSNDLTDCPYAPILDTEAPNGVGNVIAGGRAVPVFSKSWLRKDPSGRWIKAEARALPVLQRPENVVVIQTV